jgi:hypothetical protein
VLIMVVSSLVGLPPMMESVQDTFTNHFVRPDVTNGWQLLLNANVRYWAHWPILLSTNIALLSATVLGGWALWRRHRAAALIVLATAALGIALTIVHPDLTQGDRLYTLLWLAPIIGVPVAAQRVRARTAEA